MSGRRDLGPYLALLSMAVASGAFDDLEAPAVVPADPEHPGPVCVGGGPHEADSNYCCWANYMVSPKTHNADCGSAAKGDP